MNFVEKNEAEMASMNEQELAQYMKERQDYKEAQLKSAIKAENKELIAQLKSEVLEAQSESNKAIYKALDAQGTAIERMNQKSIESKPATKSLYTAEELQSLEKNGHGWSTKNLTFADSPLTTSTTIVDPIIKPLIDTSRPLMQDILTSRRINTTANSTTIVEQRNRVGGADVTAEGALKSSNDYDWVETTYRFKKITAKVKASTEILNDVSNVQEFIRTDLVTQVRAKLNTQIISGTGIGDELEGLFTVATAFSVAGISEAVVNATNFDVITYAQAQAENNFFEGAMSTNYVFVNPLDYAAMNVVKGTDGNYTVPSKHIYSSDANALELVKHSAIPAGEYLVMNSNLAQLLVREGIEVKVGYENDDFSKNMVTMIAEWRGILITPENYRGGLIKGVFATDKAALEAIV